MTLVVSFQLRTYCDEQYVLRPSSAGQCGWFSVVQSQSSFAGSDSNGKGTAGVCLGAAFPHRLVSYSSCILSFLKISCEPASSHGVFVQDEHLAQSVSDFVLSSTCVFL